VLSTGDGLPVGTLCVLNHRPRELTDQQKKLLVGLAEIVMFQMELGQKLRDAETIQQEVDHRVRNSLSQVQAILTLQARLSGSDELRSALEKARDRVSAVASVHDQLHRTGSLFDVNLKPFIERLATSSGAHGSQGISISADIPSVRIPAREASNVGIVINELVANALRHGFDEEQQGTIAITGELRGSELQLSIRDDGKGLPPDFDPAASSGLGMRLALMIAKQFGGQLTWSSTGRGSVFEFTVPV
jgi:two-component sensor histidine kinase